MFIAMEQCVDPSGHDWQPYSFTTRAGSTPVRCAREGCSETGYQIERQVLAQDSGLPGEELF